MKKVAVKIVDSSFLSCEKDLDKIIHLLLVDNKPYSNQLKRLLIVTNNDCLDPSKYIEDINQWTDASMIKAGYIRKRPRILVDDDIKCYIIITFTNFMANRTNPAYRDSLINIDILCHSDYWDLNDMSSRPIKIMGYVDGILNGAKLSGIGTIHFESADILLLNEELMGYSMTYSAVHEQVPGSGDDRDTQVLPL